MKTSSAASLGKLSRDGVAIGGNFLSKLLRQRQLIANFVARDLRTRYLGSAMGLLWAVIHPLVLLVSYTFIFSILFSSPRMNAEYPGNFALFLFCGILPWLYFQDSLQRSATCVLENSNLVRKTVFPTEILPLVIVGSNLVTHLLGFAVLLAALLIFHQVGWSVLVLPVVLVLLAGLTLGLSWMAAAVTVFFRDASQFLIVFLILWFWFTPIFYQMEQIDIRLPVLSPWLRMNPMTYVVRMYQDVLLSNQMPQGRDMLILSAFSVSSLVIGGVLFRILKREFADVL